MPTIETELLTVAQVAELLKIDQSTVRRWISAGSLPAYRVGQRFVRINRDDLAKVMTPTGMPESNSASVALPPQDSDTGMRFVTSPDEIRPPTQKEREQSQKAFARATELRDELRQKYGVFRPSSWELLEEARRERTEQLS